MGNYMQLIVTMEFLADKRVYLDHVHGYTHKALVREKGLASEVMCDGHVPCCGSR